MKTKLFKKAAGVIAIAIPLVGFEVSAQEMMSAEPMVVAPRVLKKRIDFGFLATQPFFVKDKTVDVNWPVNGQLQLAINNSPDFYYAGASKPFPKSATGGAGISTMSQHDDMNAVPICYRDLPQYIVGGAVTGYEFTSSFGITFGYNPAGNVGGKDLVDVTVQVSTSTMTMFLEGDNPITKQAIDMGNASSKDTQTTINASVNFANFSISPSFYFQSPISTVSMKGLTAALSSLAKAPQIAAQQWEAQVSDPGDLAMTVNAGSKAGLHCGDVLDIYNQLYYYDDKVDPCQTTAVTHFDASPGQPSATIILRQVQPDASLSGYQEGDVNYFDMRGIQAGAVVRLNTKQIDPHPERCK